MSCEKGKSRTEGPKNLKFLGNEFGLWKNSRFFHTVSTLVGVNVSVETVNDGTYEGILRTISRYLDVVLFDSHLVDEKNPEEIRQDTLAEKRVFNAKDIVRLVALDVDLDYATKKAFQTDHQISGKANGPMRELEEWKPEDGDCQELEGGLETSNNGWKPEEMFARNEQNYGVKSTYKDNLEGYTCQLSTEGKDSAEYKQREAKAAEIARQIESNASSLSAIELENGENENEEEAFSAVVRSASPPPPQPQRTSNSYHRSNRESSSEEPSSSSNNSNKYVPPPRRGLKNTPPPSRSRSDRDNDNDFNHHHHNRRRHSHHHYAHGSNYKGQQEDKSQQQHYQHNRHNNSNYNYSHRGDGKSRIAKTLSNPNKNGNHHHHNNNNNNNNNAIQSTDNNNNNNTAANNNIVKNNKESPESKKKESPVLTPSPELAVEKIEENEVIDSKRGPSPETKPRVHFSDQSPSNVASTTAATTAPSTTTPTTSSSSSSTKKSGLNPNAEEFVLNPNAKMFTSNLSRPPMSTTPSRPLTPATPAGTPATYTTQTFIPGYVHHIPTSTQPTRNRAQRDYPRPELTSPIQVAAATGSPLVPVSYPHHIPFQTQAAVSGTPPHHHHQQHGVVMRMSGVLPHNFALAAAGASSLEPLNLGGASPGQQQNQWTTAGVTTSQAPPPQQGTPQQPLTATPPAPSHTPSPGPQVIFPLAMTQHQQHSQGNNQAPPVNSLAYTHHHHPSNAATFAAQASPGSGHYPPNLLALPHTAVLSGHPPMIHPPMMPSQQGHVHGGVPLTTYIAPPTAVPGHQNHLLHSHLARWGDYVDQEQQYLNYEEYTSAIDNFCKNEVYYGSEQHGAVSTFY